MQCFVGRITGFLRSKPYKVNTLLLSQASSSLLSSSDVQTNSALFGACIDGPGARALFLRCKFSLPFRLRGIPASERFLRGLVTTSPFLRRASSRALYSSHCRGLMRNQWHEPSFSAQRTLRRELRSFKLVGDWNGMPSGQPLRSMPSFSLIAVLKLA